MPEKNRKSGLSRAITRAIRHVRGFSHRDSLLRLRNSFSFSPKIIYDIGAHHGKWSEEISKLFPDAEFFLFEANPANEKYLQNAPGRHFIVALSAEDGRKCEFFTPKTGSNTGSSLFRAQSVDFRNENLEVLSVETKKLESLARENALPLPDFIKLDVQGAEIDVLHGAAGILSNCKALIAEASFVQGNEGAPGAGAVLTAIEELGFMCVDLCKARRTVIGSVCEVDLLFVNRELYGKYLNLQLGHAPESVPATLK
ncbi:MAG: FkbM family methyltransferase [Gallionella sp.]|jgi:FkbM family methyltransferase|nr:FkbM family methyltransferase [Gallionella sp.]